MPAATLFITGPRLRSLKAVAEYLAMSIEIVRQMIQKRQIPDIFLAKYLDCHIEKIKIGLLLVW